VDESRIVGKTISGLGENIMGKVGDNIEAKNAGWSFGGGIAPTFEEHVSKSVPLYELGHELVISLGDFFIKNDSNCYELGSSSGVLTYKLAKANSSKKNAQFFGLDIEDEMIDFAKSKYSRSNLEYICADISSFDYNSGDFFVAYYTLQFVHPKLRQILVNKVYDSLNWGGAFVIFEKVRAHDARFQDISSSLYQDYKLAKGYTPDQIVSKSRSLKGVLEPFSSPANVEMLKRAGFSDVLSVQKWVCFEGFLAIK
jgi:tRNA (cmo5U34)-methyltransferase